MEAKSRCNSPKSSSLSELATIEERAIQHERVRKVNVQVKSQRTLCRINGLVCVGKQFPDGHSRGVPGEPGMKAKATGARGRAQTGETGATKGSNGSDKAVVKPVCQWEEHRAKRGRLLRCAGGGSVDVVGFIW